MKIRKGTTWAAALLAVAAVAGVASPASAAVSFAPASATSDVVVGSSTVAAAMTFKQTTGDCEEGSTDVVFGAITGARMKEATIVAEAVKLGVLSKDTADGSNWGGPDGIVKLLAHYGLSGKIGSHTSATVEADLKAGDKVIAFVDSAVLWNTFNEAELIATFGGPAPAGEIWSTGAFTDAGADHALVLDSIDETAKTATVSDTGAGFTYTVSLATWSAAMAPSGYSYTIVQPHAAKK